MEDEINQAKKTSKIAITSFIIGLLSIPLFFFRIGSIAIILGIISLFIIRKHNLKGNWLAISGIILGVIGIILSFVPYGAWFNLAFQVEEFTEEDVQLEQEDLNEDFLALTTHTSEKFSFTIDYPSNWRVKELNFRAEPKGKGVKFSKISNKFPDCENCFEGAEFIILTYDDRTIQNALADYDPIYGIDATTVPIDFLGFEAYKVEYEKEQREQYSGQFIKWKIIILKKSDKLYTIAYRYDSSLTIKDNLESMINSFRFI